MRRLKLSYVDEHGNETEAASIPITMLGGSSQEIETSVGIALMNLGESMNRVTHVVPIRQRIVDRILQES